MARMRLAGKRALVTGAASGIGRAAALLFAAEGAKVLCGDRDERVDETASAIARQGGTAHAVVADVSSEADVERLVGESVARLGGLDACFANAGIVGRLASLDDLDARDWLDVLRVNLVGAALTVKHAARHMRAHGGGAIVCTASVAGLRSGAGPAPYSASKAGVLNLVATSAVQLSGTGVRVNAICPGLVETGMTREVFQAARAAGKADKIGQLNPLRRAGEAEEIAEAALFLCSDASRYVNGTQLVVDGGLAASLPAVPGKLW
jgi:NAD(P)-dependent dehydrogenase (short-subunit alcohol dehydrogenase family)